MSHAKPLNLTTYLQELSPRRVVNLDMKFDPEGLPPAFKPTIAFRSVVERFNYAVEVGTSLALITGAHGAGKTTAFKYIAHNHDALYWEARPSYRPQHLLGDIAQRLGVNAGQGWHMQTSIVVDQLYANPRRFLVDEAQRLNYEGMDLLKYLADQSGSLFMLSASPSLEKRIDKWPDIASRCNVRARISAMGSDEMLSLYDDSGFSRESLLEIHRISEGVMRVVQAILREIDIHLKLLSEETGRPYTREGLAPGHVQVFAEKVVGSRV
ncbi:MAG: AAA family ATPase [Deinococcota bacterium]